MRRARTIGAALLALGLFGIGLALAADSPRGAPYDLDLRAAGGVQLDNSRNGLAILGAHGLAPGDSITGQVTVRNASAVSGGLRLAQTVRSELAGTGGEQILDSLLLDIRGPAGTVVYTGPARAMGSANLPEIAAGEARTYTFTAALPSSAGDAMQLASASLDYTWTATSPDVAVPATGGGAPCALGRLGTRRADVLAGTEDGDRIAGRRGNDRLSGLGGDDCLTGGPGNDALTGGTGADLLKGGAGNDRIRARDGEPDRIRCGSGADLAILDRADRAGGCERRRVR